MGMRLGLGLGLGMQSAAPDTRPRVLYVNDFGANTNPSATDFDNHQVALFVMMTHNLVNFRGFGCCYVPTDSTGKAAVQALIDGPYTTDYARLIATGTGYLTPTQLRARVYQGLTAAQPAAGYGASPSELSSKIIEEAYLARDAGTYLWILNGGPGTDLSQALHDDPNIWPYIRIIATTDRSGLGYNYTTDPFSYDYIAAQRAPGQPLDDMWYLSCGQTHRGIYVDSGGNSTIQRDFAWRYAAGHGAIGDYFMDCCIDVETNSKDGAKSIAGAAPWLYIIDNVLTRGNVNDPTQAGWGGRYERNLTLGNNYWYDIQSGQTLGTYVGANTVYIWRSEIYAWAAAQFDRLVATPPTIHAVECFHTLGATDSNIFSPARNLDTGPGAWGNFRNDGLRLVDATFVNNSRDYLISQTSTATAEITGLSGVGASVEIEGQFWSSATGSGNSQGLMLGLSGKTGAASETRLQAFIDTNTGNPWLIQEIINGSTTQNNSVTQASSITIPASTFYRQKLRCVDLGGGSYRLTAFARRPFVTDWVEIGHIDTAISPASKNFGVRVGISSRFYGGVARSYA